MAEESEKSADANRSVLLFGPSPDEKLEDGAAGIVGLFGIFGEAPDVESYVAMPTTLVSVDHNEKRAKTTHL